MGRGSSDNDAQDDVVFALLHSPFNNRSNNSNNNSNTSIQGCSFLMNGMNEPIAVEKIWICE